MKLLYNKTHQGASETRRGRVEGRWAGPGAFPDPPESLPASWNYGIMPSKSETGSPGVRGFPRALVRSPVTPRESGLRQSYYEAALSAKGRRGGFSCGSGSLGKAERRDSLGSIGVLRAVSSGTMRSPWADCLPSKVQMLSIPQMRSVLPTREADSVGKRTIVALQIRLRAIFFPHSDTRTAAAWGAIATNHERP